MEFLENAELINIQSDGMGKVQAVSIQTPQGVKNVDTDFIFHGAGRTRQFGIGCSIT